jgi:hypothetical protein
LVDAEIILISPRVVCATSEAREVTRDIRIRIRIKTVRPFENKSRNKDRLLRGGG